MSRRSRGMPFMKYAGLMLMAYSTGDMITNVSTKTGQPIMDITLLFVAGWFILRSKIAAGVKTDVMVLFVALMFLLMGA